MKPLLLILLFILSLGAGERIVSLSPSITEIVYGLGAGGALVATSSYSLYPEASKKLPAIGSVHPNIEQILSYHPTLVIGEDYNQKSLKKLKYFHIKTAQIRLKTVQDIQNSITQLGTILHQEQKAKALTTNITDAITDTNKTTKPHSVMIVYGAKEDLRSGIYIAGGHIFFDDIITLSGNTNAYTDNTTSQPVLNYENVIALNPDQIIILHSHATQPNADLKKVLKAWQKIPTNASKNSHISIVDEEYLHIPSQRVALTVKRLMKEMLKYL